MNAGVSYQENAMDKSSLINKILPKTFFCRPAELVAPDLLGCKLVKRNSDRNLLWGVIVETEAYSQKEPACHGFNRRSPSNETLFGDPGIFYIYMTYGMYHCVNIVTDKSNWASGVLLRAIAIPGENERIASGPGLIAMRFGLNRLDDGCQNSIDKGLWIASPNEHFKEFSNVINTTRIGISKAKDLPWRWYLKSSRSISKRSKGDKCPPIKTAWFPEKGSNQ
tara:strand:- start:1452 stop:2120 length:669 start_codon:yes stop_codon:yes gene_type:complete